MSVVEAETNYYTWTHKLLKACQARYKRSGQFWAYVQVTERQKRQHPHSHIITTFLPHDAVLCRKMLTDTTYREVYTSDWFLERCIAAGLGWQYEITQVREPKGVASYCAKYLFKDAIFTKWPKGWKRIRYSRSFPKPHKDEISDGFPIMSINDWRRIKLRKIAIHVDTMVVYDECKRHNIDTIVYGGN